MSLTVPIFLTPTPSPTSMNLTTDDESQGTWETTPYAVGDRFGRSIQSVPGILPPNERHTFSYDPESKSITTATDNVLHRVNPSTDAHYDDIDYESKSCY